MNSTKEQLNWVLTGSVGPSLDQNHPINCDGGGWIRVSFLKLTDSSELSPSNWTLYSSPVRDGRRRQFSGPTCDSVIFFFYLMGNTTLAYVCAVWVMRKELRKHFGQC